MNKLFGEEMSELFVELETNIIQYAVLFADKPNYTSEGFRAAIMIFESALLDKMWELQCDDKIEQKDREAMTTKAGEDLRKFVKTYTGIDTHEIYK